MPGLWTMRVVDRHRLARHGRDFARVCIAWEIDHLRAARAKSLRALAAGGLAPAGAVVEHELRSSEPRRGFIRLTRERAPGRAVLGDELGERDDGVAGDAHARGVGLPRVRLDQNGE